MILVLFTHSYPYDYDAEQTFVQDELPHLLHHFGRLVVVPRVCRGLRLSVAPGVEIEEGYARAFRSWRRNRAALRRVVASGRLTRELRRRPAILWSPPKLAKLLFHAMAAELTKDWTVGWLRPSGCLPAECVLYSYWLDQAASGLGLCKESLPDVKVVARAHGYDLYEEHYFPHYWPHREETLANLDAVFFASQAARGYMQARYPQFQAKYETGRLGVPDPGFVAQPSGEGVLRIVSVSHIYPVKRLGLLLEGVLAIARLRPQQQVLWTHFGGGKGLGALEAAAYRSRTTSISTSFEGTVSHEKILGHFREQPVDVFVNVSKTEGLPVSIQEAMSCGIPVVATRVGGNPEAVLEDGGVLLSPDPSPEEIARAILSIWEDPDWAARMRTAARRTWQERFDARVNFAAFAHRLKSIRDG